MSEQSKISSYMEEIKKNPIHESILFEILEAFIDLFPVKNAYLVRYSPIGHIFEGVIAIRGHEVVSVTDLRDDLRAYPFVLEALLIQKPLYLHGKEFIKNMNTNMKYTTNEMLIVPITFNNFIYGYIGSNCLEENAYLNMNLLDEFGIEVGKLLVSNASTKKKSPLSKRELEVMQKVAEGESSKEIAHLLNISDLTVNSYIKSAIKKIQAKNRIEAVIKLYKAGLIV